MDSRRVRTNFFGLIESEDLRLNPLCYSGQAECLSIVTFLTWCVAFFCLYYLRRYRLFPLPLLSLAAHCNATFPAKPAEDTATAIRL